MTRPYLCIAQKYDIGTCPGFLLWLRVPCSTLNTDGTRTRCPENQLKRSSGENEGPRNQSKDSPVNFLELWRQKVPDVAENPSDRDQWIE